MKRRGRPPQAPLYTLPHGIEVVGEYAPSGQNRYWRVRIRPHAFFPDTTLVFGGHYVRRSRVLLAAKLGRALTAEDIAHHGDEDKTNDSLANLELTTPAEHNRQHKAGTKQDAASKARISSGLRKAYADGRRARPVITHRDQQGRITR